MPALEGKMDVDGWLRTFRALGTKAQSLARPLAGTAKGRKELGTGAGGDVTVYMDRVLEDILIDKCKRIGNVRLISEELGVRDFGKPELSVIADPLDGSVNAKSGIALYSVLYAIGPPGPTLGNLRMGYVRNLVSGQEYWAFRGKGAYCDGKRIHAQKDDALKILLVELSPVVEKDLRAVMPLMIAATRVRSLGSMALDMCYAATGAVSGVADLRGGRLRPLDLSAGKLILEEAGGLVTGGRGESLDDMSLDLGNHTDILAAGNPGIHKRLLEARRP